MMLRWFLETLRDLLFAIAICAFLLAVFWSQRKPENVNSITGEQIKPPPAYPEDQSGRRKGL